MLGVAADEAVHEELELVGVRDVDRAPVLGDQVGRQVVDELGVGLGEAEFAEELEGDAADDEASGRLVDQAVEVRQADRGDDAAGETGTLDQQRLRAGASGSEGGRGASTAASADKDIGLDGFHVEIQPQYWVVLRLRKSALRRS